MHVKVGPEYLSPYDVVISESRTSNDSEKQDSASGPEDLLSKSV